MKRKNQDVLMDIGKVGQLPLIKSLLPKQIKYVKHLGGKQNLENIYFSSAMLAEQWLAEDQKNNHIFCHS